MSETGVPPSDSVIPPSDIVAPPTQTRRKHIRKRGAPDFPVRITTCIAIDQAEALAATKKRLHASESQIVRLALDNFCNAVNPQNQNNGGPHG